MTAARAAAADIVVVKIGGALLKHPAALDAVVGAVVDASRDRRLVVVPGGGPFADAVRAADQAVRLGSSAAHWMAVLAMDQYAHLLASRTVHAEIVSSRYEIDGALDTGRLPVLAPSAWLRRTDPLPHSWDVTSDSIAAWVAGALGAARLVLVKPPGSTSVGATDAYFSRALPHATTHAIVTGDDVDALRSLLHDGAESARLAP